MGLRIVVGADIAGFDYKEQLKKDFEADDRVDEVIDVGIGSGEDVDYPHVAVTGARLVADADATLREFGAPGDDVDQLLDGPFADPSMRDRLEGFSPDVSAAVEAFLAGPMMLR